MTETEKMARNHQRGLRANSTKQRETKLVIDALFCAIKWQRSLVDVCPIDSEERITETAKLNEFIGLLKKKGYKEWEPTGTMITIQELSKRFSLKPSGNDGSASTAENGGVAKGEKCDIN